MDKPVPGTCYKKALFLCDNTDFSEFASYVRQHPSAIYRCDPREGEKRGLGVSYLFVSEIFCRTYRAHRAKPCAPNGLVWYCFRRGWKLNTLPGTQPWPPQNIISTSVQQCIARQPYRRSPATHQGNDNGEPRRWPGFVLAFLCAGACTSGNGQRGRAKSRLPLPQTIDFWGPQSQRLRGCLIR